MPFHFCTQCGTKLQPDFRFCPSCGEKLPALDETLEQAGTAADTAEKPKKTASHKSGGNENLDGSSSALVSPRPPLARTRNALRLQREKSPTEDSTSSQGNGVGSKLSLVKPEMDVKLKVGMEQAPEVSPKSPIPVERKSRISKRVRLEKPEEEVVKLNDGAAKMEEEPPGDCLPGSSLPSSPIAKSPRMVKGKAKKAKRVSTVKPIEEGEVVTDTTGRKWMLGKLLRQNTTDLIYEVSAFKSNSDSKHILKLGAKVGKIFAEQNFLQRASKPSSVDKWITQMKLDFLGVPSCAGFGLHAEDYRFLIFPSMGKTLISVMEEEGKALSEKVVLQLACRILDVLEFIHSKEYVHADIHAENIYIQMGKQAQVYLVGYHHAFRYCPGGQHVEYREDSRTPHDGALEFISVDSHKGAGPSRRSDLQSLGYCMLRWHTGMLPWTSLTEPQHIATEKQKFNENVPALLSNCFGTKKVSGAMQQYLTMVMALQYSDTPDYSALKAGLRKALLQLGGSLEQPLSF